MKIRVVYFALIALLPSLALAQPPSYNVEFLGEFFVAKMNENTQMIGVDTVGGNQRGFVVSPGQPRELLPLPAGMISSLAIDINEQDMIVGAVSPDYSPEFNGRAAAWYPDPGGGYTVEFLGTLPGQSLSRATAVNNVGDILGYSSDGTYRYPVRFSAPGVVTNLSSTGIFDPADVNDQRLVVDHSFTVKRLDLNTMLVEDLGIPQGSYLATSAAMINEANQVAGLAIRSGGGNCDRVAARYTDGAGWEIFSSCGQYNGVNAMNDLGDLVMRLNVASYVHYEGLGAYLIEDLIVNDIGHWYVLNGFGLAIDNARRMVVGATNPVTGQTGAVVLTPVETSTAVDPAPLSLRLAPTLHQNTPNPFNPRTTLSFDLPRPGRVTLSVIGMDGGIVRVLVDESLPAGSHAVSWNGRDEASRPAAAGVYLSRLETADGVATQKLVLLR